MNAKKIGIFSIITIFILLLIPQKIVWGGNPYQTVPTIGPSRTPTTNFSATATQTSNTSEPGNIPTASNPTATQFPVIVTTATIDILMTETPSVGKETSSTSSIVTDQPSSEAVTGQLSTKTKASTSVVLLPSVSNAEQSSEVKTEKTSRTSVPAFVFPLVVILLFIVVYLITKNSIKKSIENNKTKKL